jgi:hypothetical protein
MIDLKVIDEDINEALSLSKVDQFRPSKFRTETRKNRDCCCLIY